MSVFAEHRGWSNQASEYAKQARAAVTIEEKARLEKLAQKYERYAREAWQDCRREAAEDAAYEAREYRESLEE